MSSNSSQQQRSVLGKGLASLLPGISNPPTPPLKTTIIAGAQPATEPAFSSQSARHMGISMLPIDQIKANEYQPRRDFNQTALEELAQSIKENGLIQPLVIRKNGEIYELIAGERRLRASKLAGLTQVPVVIRRSTDREALELAIVENIQREDLNCVDEALAYFQLLQEFQLSQEELAKKMGKDRATVANALRVLKLSDSIIIELKNGTLSRGHAKALLSVEEPTEREKLAKEIIEKNLSVRQTEKLAQEIKTEIKSAAGMGGTTKKITAKIDPELMRAAQTLTKKFMTKVEIKGGVQSGTIQLHYSSVDELTRMMHLLMGE